MNITTVAYSVILVGGVALFGFGHPAGGAPPPPTSPIPSFPSVVAAVPATAANSVTYGGVTLTSFSVNLPESDREFPPGPGAEVTQANCVACHSTGMVMNQPALSRVTWETEVHKMIAVYKAPVSDDDANTIVAYLDSIKGAK